MITKIQLIDDARKAWKFWSIRLQILGTSITGFFAVFPNVAIEAWQQIPQEIKQMLPPKVLPVIGVVICIAAVIARLVKQPKLKEDSQNATD